MLKWCVNLLWVCFALAWVVLLAGFAATNNQLVSVQLFPLTQSVDAPLYMLTIGLFSVGAFVAWGIATLCSIKRRLHTHRSLSTKDKRIQALEDELAVLRMEAEMHARIKATTQATTLAEEEAQKYSMLPVRAVAH